MEGNMFAKRDNPSLGYSESAATTAFNKSIAPILHALNLMLYSEHMCSFRSESTVGPNLLGANLGNAYRLAYEAYDLHHNTAMLADEAMLAIESIDRVLDETGNAFEELPPPPPELPQPY